MKTKVFILSVIFFISLISINAQQKILKKGGNYNYIILDDGTNITIVDRNFNTIGQMLNAVNVLNYIPVQNFIVMKEKNGYLVSYDSTLRELGRKGIPPNFKDNDYKVTDNYILLVENGNIETYDKNFKILGSFSITPQVKKYWATDNYILVMNDMTIATYDKYFQKLNDRLANQYLKDVVTPDNYIVTKEVNLTDTGIPINPNEDDDSYYIFDTKFNQLGRKQITTNLELEYFTNDYVLTKEGSHLYTYNTRFNKIGDKYIRSELNEYIPADGYIITKEGDNLYTYNPNFLKMGEYHIESDILECDAAKGYILIKTKDSDYTFDTKFNSIGKIKVQN